MYKSILSLIIIALFSSLSVAQDTSAVKKKSLEFAMISINFDQTDIKGDNTSIASEIVSLYAMFGDSKLDTEGLERNRHGFVAHAGLTAAGSSTLVQTGVTTEATISTAVFGVHAGAGYGVYYNDFSGYATINNSVVSYFGSSADNVDSETSFLPSNSAFMRFAGMWSPLDGKAGSFVGIHTALNVSLAEGGGSSLLVGLSFSPRY